MSSRALVGSTKYVVVSHSVTSCSAVLTTDVNRVLHVCTGDGRSIVGGSVSIPNASTVSVNTTVDEYGAAQVAGSTVTVTGGSTTLSGTCILGGTFSPADGLVIASGSTISGVGTGAVISGVTNSTAISVYNSTISISNMVFDDIYNTSTSSQSQMALFFGGFINLTNCKFTNYHHSTTATGIFYGVQGMAISNCYFRRDGAKHDIYTTSPSATVSISGSTFYSIVSYNSSTIRLSGFNKVEYLVGKINDASGSDNVILVNGSTTNITASARNAPIKSNQVTVEGTATIVYSGGTVKVTGTGSYFAKDGTTDLTIVS